jgi:hypothetical protein
MKWHPMQLKVRRLLKTPFPRWRKQSQLFSIWHADCRNGKACFLCPDLLIHWLGTDPWFANSLGK